MGINIRAAKAEDAGFLAWLILTAGRAHVKRGIWEAILNEPEDRCLAFLELLTVTNVPHLFHHSCYLVAEAAEGPVAGLGGYDSAILGYPALQSALPEVFSKIGFCQPNFTGIEPPRILECIPDKIDGAWVIDSVATSPKFRRKGIAGMLLEEILEKGRILGFRQSQVDIYIGNTAAQRAYEKFGFKVMDEKRDPYFEAEIGAPGMARMVRDL